VFDEVWISAYRRANDFEERRFIKRSRFLLYSNAATLRPKQKP
jgi:hypothetical protein